MAQKSPRFLNPPVVETILGVQFNSLAGWTNAHSGWYWRQCLDKGWGKPADAPPLPDQFELFGTQRVWSPMGPQVLFRPHAGSSRVQINNATEDRMIQIQATRFHYNWQKRDNVYPTYPTMRAEFDGLFTGFCKFVAEAGLGGVTPNLWELTYVDFVPRGVLWDTPADWHKIIPGLLPANLNLGGAAFESVGGEWNYAIGDERGRIHLSLQYGRVDPAGSDVLRLESTARGPVRPEGGWGLADGLDFGHDAIIELFMDATSKEAHRAWGLEGDWP